ncbi:hypothetical protein Pst134EB_014036 [Puccinia striiformis f. sp. tritici]|nr:hypothetical protein Pst134EB_014036 [Puccinia striiformis f. sp. tritici]
MMQQQSRVSVIEEFRNRGQPEEKTGNVVNNQKRKDQTNQRRYKDKKEKSKKEKVSNAVEDVWIKHYKIDLIAFGRCTVTSHVTCNVTSHFQNAIEFSVPKTC